MTSRSGRAAGRRPWLIQCHRTRPLGLWVSGAKNGDPGTHWVGIMDFIGLSNDIKWWYSSHWAEFQGLVWEDDFRLVTHIDWQKEISLFPWSKVTTPGKEFSQLFYPQSNSINYHSKMAMFYGQPPWPLKFLLPKEQLDFSSTPQPADWFQVTALGNQKALTCAGNYRKTQEISPPKR